MLGKKTTTDHCRNQWPDMYDAAFGCVLKSSCHCHPRDDVTCVFLFPGNRLPVSYKEAFLQRERELFYMRSLPVFNLTWQLQKQHSLLYLNQASLVWLIPQRHFVEYMQVEWIDFQAQGRWVTTCRSTFVQNVSFSEKRASLLCSREKKRLKPCFYECKRKKIHVFHSWAPFTQDALSEHPTKENESETLCWSFGSKLYFFYTFANFKPKINKQKQTKITKDNDCVVNLTEKLNCKAKWTKLNHSAAISQKKRMTVSTIPRAFFSGVKDDLNCGFWKMVLMSPWPISEMWKNESYCLWNCASVVMRYFRSILHFLLLFPGQKQVQISLQKLSCAFIEQFFNSHVSLLKFDKRDVSTNLREKCILVSVRTLRKTARLFCYAWILASLLPLGLSWTAAKSARKWTPVQRPSTRTFLDPSNGLPRAVSPDQQDRSVSEAAQISSTRKDVHTRLSSSPESSAQIEEFLHRRKMSSHAPSSKFIETIPSPSFIFSSTFDTNSRRINCVLTRKIKNWQRICWLLSQR